jgi:hypothetical protein
MPVSEERWSQGLSMDSGDENEECDDDEDMDMESVVHGGSVYVLHGIDCGDLDRSNLETACGGSVLRCEDGPTARTVTEKAKDDSEPLEEEPSVVDSPIDPIQSSLSTSNGEVDVTAIPRHLDAQFEALDKEGAVRPTIITPGKEWTRRAKKALLAHTEASSMGADEQEAEKNRAFDLLDALSRSGGLTVDHASLHVVIAATHCFDRSIIDTLVMDNVNPIAKVERSTLIMAATVHERPAAELLARGDQSSREVIRL